MFTNFTIRMRMKTFNIELGFVYLHNEFWAYWMVNY